MIPRRLTRLERLRPDDIPDAVPREEHRAGDLLLRVSRDVGTDHGQAEAEPQALEIAQPERDQAPPFVGLGQGHEQRGPDDANAVGDDHAGAARVEPVRVAGRDHPADEQREELYRSPWDLEILCAEGVEAEGLDDDGCELVTLRLVCVVYI